MLEQFHANQPNLQVFYTPDPENVAEQMIADAQAGRAPDVFAGCCDFFPLWAQQGVLLDLRPFVEADLEGETIDDWDQASAWRPFRSAWEQIYTLGQAPVEIFTEVSAQIEEAQSSQG